MRRNILILALCAMSLNACVISHSDTSNYKFLPEVAEFKAESRLEFPMVMVETAMAIEAYQEMSAQEKVQMGYIYKSAVSTGEGRYKMDRFYEYYLDMNGKSISQPDAEWIIKTEAGSFDRYFTQTTMRLTRPDTPEHEYRLVCDYKGYPSYEILFSSLDESGDVQVNGAALTAVRNLAVQAACSFVLYLFNGVAQSNFVKVAAADDRILAGHGVLNHRHICHNYSTSFLNRLHASS
jgi:hypothetical protein